MRVIKVHSIEIQQTLRSGRLLREACLTIKVPYSTEGWAIGCWNIPHKDIISLRCMFNVSKG